MARTGLRMKPTFPSPASLSTRQTTRYGTPTGSLSIRAGPPHHAAARGEDRRALPASHSPVGNRRARHGRSCRRDSLRSSSGRDSRSSPASRTPTTVALENLVVAHARCNAQKRGFLAAVAHVGHWRARTRSGSPVSAELDRVAEAIGWTRHPDRTLGVARALYLRLPEDARLWLRGEEFVSRDHGSRLKPAIQAPSGRGKWTWRRLRESIPRHSQRL